MTFRVLPSGFLALSPLSLLILSACGGDRLGTNQNQPDGTQPVCGDGVLDTGEECDDGNAAWDDGCSPSCHVEPGWNCSSGTCETYCGDGLAMGSETCDGSDLRGQTCSSQGQAPGVLACTAQCEWDLGGCTGPAVCGDGLLQVGEACDDGNFANCDGCSSFCRVEVCGNGLAECLEDCDQLGETATCDADCTFVACGDGVVNATAGEACDDDNLTAGDGCSATCGVEAGWDCAGEPSVCGALTCGDGLQVGDEGCDDGNLEGEDGCSATCTVEPGWTCFGTTPSQCLPGAFVTIAAGTFTMGSPVGEPGREVTEVQHQVTLTGAFEIYATEVTQLQFDAVMGYNDSANQGCPTCPVEQVSWSEAAAYCNALSVQAGYPTCYACTGTFHDTQCDLDAAYATPYDCPGYRLPTEAEWEYATRAGTTGGTYNGTSPWIDNNQPNPVLDPIAWFGGNSANHTHPVGELQPNAWGLYDTLGNAYEWVHDWSEAYAGDAIDPWGPSVGAFRGYRGGSYYDVAACARAGGYRFRSDAWGTTKADLGFRPARSL